MRNKFLLIIIFFLFLFVLTSCTQKADAEYLTGGNWIATAGYEDGEAKGEPNCHFFEKGLEFKDKETVYNASFEEEFTYSLSDRNKLTEVTFIQRDRITFTYNIHVISENEMGFEGLYSGEGESCYLERK